MYHMKAINDGNSENRKVAYALNENVFSEIFPTNE